MAAKPLILGVHMDLDDFQEGVFTVWQPNAVDLLKSDTATQDPPWRIGGFASTADLDRQDETCYQKGLDFREFIQHGWFNDNHQQHTSAAIGLPETAELKSKGWYVTGTLLKEMPRAQEIYTLAKALQPTRRRLGFSIEGKILERVGNKISKALIRNVAITNCFPADTTVVGSAEGVSRRWYSGPMIEIQLSTGQKLTGTPNHPVLTERGWVALGDLDKIHDRVSAFLGDNLRLLPSLSGKSSAVSHDVEHMPSTLEQVFNLAMDDPFGVLHRVCAVCKGDFHGDVLANDSHVDIVPMDGLLKDRFEAQFFKKLGKRALPASDKQLSFFTGFSAQHYALGGVLRATANGLGFCGEGQAQAFLSRGHGAFPPRLLLPHGTGNAVPFGHVIDGVARHSVLGRDGGRRHLSKAVGFSDIKLKRCFNFDGHVFNLQTGHGWYLANGVVAHNSPVNTSCQWDLISKSWASDTEMKAMDVGYQYPPTSGAGVLVPESLEGGEVRVVYECPSCKKVFSSEGALNTHLQTRHTVQAKSLAASPPETIRRSCRLLAKSEALQVLARIHPEWTEASRLAVVEHCFKHYA